MKSEKNINLTFPEKETKQPDNPVMNLTAIGARNFFAENGLPRPAYEASRRLSFLDKESSPNWPHFADAVEICQMLESLWQNLSEEQLKKIKQASLLHDIGKAGPIAATAEQQKSFVKVFNLIFEKEKYNEKSIRELTISEALQVKVEEGQLKKSEAIVLLKNLCEAAKDENREQTKISKETKMIDFWSAHVYWSVDLLKFLNIEEEIIKIVAAHHIWDGHNPENLASINENQFKLMLADRYQAFRRRSGKNHQETMVILRKTAQSKLVKEKEKILCEEIMQEMEKLKDFIK